MYRVIYNDLRKLRETVTKLVYENRLVIQERHIRSLHEVKGFEIIYALLYGTPIKHDKEVKGRYVTWSKFTKERKLIRVIFEIINSDGEYINVVSAFEE